jgi:hypothetical protein
MTRRNFMASLAPQAKHRYFPIPQDEINANPGVTQNVGW